MNIRRNLAQTATYWPRTGSDGFGQPTFGNPTALPCRWEDKAEAFIDKRGQETVSRARVFFDSEIDVEGYLAKGDLTAEVNPLSLDSAYEVRQLKGTPDLRNMTQLYVAML